MEIVKGLTKKMREGLRTLNPITSKYKKKIRKWRTERKEKVIA
jgi:hypothetical protein